MALEIRAWKLYLQRRWWHEFKQIMYRIKCFILIGIVYVVYVNASQKKWGKDAARNAIGLAQVQDKIHLNTPVMYSI